MVGRIQLGGATPSALQPRHESPRLRPVPKIENQHAWCVFLNAGGPLCFRYPTRQTAQLFYRPDGYHGPSKMLGSCHSAEGELHWRTITLYHKSGVLFCRYCVPCISFEMAYLCDNIWFNVNGHRRYAIILGLMQCGIHDLQSLVLEASREWHHCHTISHVCGMFTLVT
jgi:hypothetical protein